MSAKNRNSVRKKTVRAKTNGYTGVSDTAPPAPSRWFPEISPPNIRVLIVDDDPANLELISRLLQRAGFQIKAVSDGRSCLKTFQSWKPDLLVCDVMLPDLNGLEICRWIKGSPAFDSTFIALISSEEISSESTVAGLRSGADAYITRPLANQEFVTRIHTLARIQQTGLALRQSEQRFQTLAKTAPVGIIRTDAEGQCVYVNDHWCEMSGLRPSDAIGKQWTFAYHPDDADRMEREWQKAVRKNLPFRSECRLVRPEGDIRWMISRGATETDLNGTITGYIGALVDITDRKAAEEDLAALNATLEKRVEKRTAELARTNERLLAESQERLTAESRFATFMENVPIAAWIKDSRFRYVYVNKEVERIFGRPLRQWLGKTDAAIFPRKIAQQTRRIDQAAIDTGHTIRINESVPDAKGRIRHYLTLKFPLTNGDGQTCPAGVAMDITEKIEAEEALRQLPHRILEAQENERHRVARELHDGVSQLLASVRFRCQSIARHLSGHGNKTVLKEIEQTKTYLERALQEVRNISHNLRPSELDDFGLISAIRSLGEQFDLRTRSTLAMKLTPLKKRLTPELELALYRILQESLSNVEKHAKATRVEVTLEIQKADIILTVSDNGRGFEFRRRRSRKGNRSGLGLINIRERAEFIGGTVAIHSTPDEGTRIEVAVPVKGLR